jgi:hypothetical protein
MFEHSADIHGRSWSNAPKLLQAIQPTDNRIGCFIGPDQKLELLKNFFLSKRTNLGKSIRKDEKLAHLCNSWYLKHLLQTLYSRACVEDNMQMRYAG